LGGGGGAGTVDFKRPFLTGNMQILQTHPPTGKSFSFKDLSKKRRVKLWGGYHE